MTKSAGPAGAVDRGQPVPLYHQIYLRLREEITSGERAFGSRLPTEQELSAQFDVSRITARRALDELAENGMVARRRRTGTTVTFRSPARPIEGDIEQALESLLEFGRATVVELLAFETVPARPPIDVALELPEGSAVLRVVRLRSLDGGPLGHYISHVPAALAEAITPERLRTTPILSLIEQGGVELGSARQTISATLADAALAAALQVEIGSPILRVSRTVLDKAGRPVQHILAQYRPDRYQIRLDLNAPGTAGRLA